MALRKDCVITSLGFNQDQGCFTCCLKSGLRVYNVEPLVEKTHYNKEELGEVSLCEMVFRTNWLLVVKARLPCSLLILDDNKRKFYGEVHFKTPIRAIKARKDKVAVVLSASIQVLHIPSLRRVTLVRTPSGGSVCGAFCSLGERPVVALTADPRATPLLAARANRLGCTQLLDISRIVRNAQSSAPAVVTCHKSEIVCLSLSYSGSKLATASARGTIIRIWDTNTKLMLHELRRGSDYADVYCINFNSGGSLVCCVSDKGTVHVWAARGPHLGQASAQPDTRALCAFGLARPHDAHAIVVISEDGSFYKFTFSPEGRHHCKDFDYFLQVGGDDEFTL